MNACHCFSSSEDEILANMHITSEIEPGLTLVLFDMHVPRETKIRRIQDASLAFSIVVDGAITFHEPLSGKALSDSVILSASSESFPVEATIVRSTRLRSVDLHIDPAWLQHSDCVLGDGVEAKKLRQIARHEQKFSILQQSDALRTLAVNVLDNANSEDSGLTRIQRKSAAYELLYELAKSLIAHEEGQAIDDCHDLVANIYHRLKEAPELYDTVGDLAADFGISGRALSKAFQDRFGVSAAKAIRNSRLERAHRLIENGKPVSVAGFEAGYKNASSFSSAFSSYFGYAPKTVKFSFPLH